MRNLVYVIIMLLFVLGIITFISWRIYSKLYRVCARPESEFYHKRRAKYEKYLKKIHGAKPVYLKSEDNINLAGLLIKRPNAKRVIIILHGYRQAKEFVYSWVDLFKEDTLFLIDFRAHGQSKGDIITFGYNESKDIKAAVNFLKSQKDMQNLPLCAIGLSMGSVALVKAVVEGAPIKAIVLDSGFACLETQLRYAFSSRTGLPPWFFSIAKFLINWHLPNCFEQVRPFKLINKIQVPVFIIHSSSDKVVPVECAQILYNYAHNPKELWIMSGPKHVHIHKEFSGEYKERVLNFFSSANKEFN